MIIKHSEIPVVPERREEALELLRGLARDSRAEAGVVEYRVAVDIEDSNTVRIFERYEDRAAAQAHEASDHLAAFERAFDPCLDGDATLSNFAVSEFWVTDGP